MQGFRKCISHTLSQKLKEDVLKQTERKPRKRKAQALTNRGSNIEE